MSLVFSFDKADLSSAIPPNAVAFRDAVKHGMAAARQRSAVLAELVRRYFRRLGAQDGGVTSLQ